MRRRAFDPEQKLGILAFTPSSVDTGVDVHSSTLTRRYLSEESMAKLYTEPTTETLIEEALLAVTA